MLRRTVVSVGLGTIGLLLAACDASGPGSHGAESAQPADPAKVEKSLQELLASADVDQGKRLMCF